MTTQHNDETEPTAADKARRDYLSATLRYEAASHTYRDALMNCSAEDFFNEGNAKRMAVLAVADARLAATEARENYLALVRPRSLAYADAEHAHHELLVEIRDLLRALVVGAVAEGKA